MQQLIIATKHILTDTMNYRGEKLLTYKIEFPQFISPVYPKTAQRMNTYYKEKAQAFERHIRKILYRQAVEQYHYSQENGYPVMVYEAVQAYTITYISNLFVSLYTDQYTFTGGAHGTTVRTSETWNLPRGYILPLKALFPPQFNYRSYILRTIIDEIERQNESGESVYFDDYKENVNNTFNENSFYLTPEGIVIYFQQYDIAPYSTGLPEFVIPYFIKR